jgi:catechol 2,3-dioxygenase-like lactoylglutathione lyase family enzyme
LGVADLGRSRAFYAETLGLIVEDADRETLYLRGIEERQHHSLVLRHGEVPTAQHLGFKVGSEEDLDKAARFFKAQGDRARVRRAALSRPYADGRRPLRHAGRTEKRERLLQRYGTYKGVQPQRLDHF